MPSAGGADLGYAGLGDCVPSLWGLTAGLGKPDWDMDVEE